jgi:hypothetical protein
LAFASVPRLKSAAAILSFPFFIFNCYYFPRLVNFKVMNEGIDIIVSGESATSPQEFQYLRNEIGCKLMNFNAVGCQDISKFF